jgi:hypothetical protein
MEPEAAFVGVAGWLLGDAVGAFPGVVLRRLDLLAAFAAQNADEAPNVVRLPLRDPHDLGKRGALGTFHQRDNIGLLVGALFRFASAVLGAFRFLCELAFLAGVRFPLAGATTASGLVLFSDAITFSVISFSWTGLRSRPFIALVGRNCKANSQRLG